MPPSLAEVLAIKPTGLYGEGDHEKRGFGGVEVPQSGYLADLFRVPIDYVMEIREQGELLRSISLPLDPAQIRVRRPTPTALSFSLGDLPIRELSEHRYLLIEIVGRSGLTPRSGYNRHGEIIYADGPKLVREFDAFLDVYQTLGAELHSYIISPDVEIPRNGIQLVFRALNKRLHLLVEPQEWETGATADKTRHSTEWRLTLQAYAPATPEEPDNFLGPVADYAEYATAMLNWLNSFAAAGDNLLKNARSDLEVLRGPLRALQQTGQLARSIADSLDSIADFPRVLVGDIERIAGQFVMAAEGLLRARDSATDSFSAVIQPLVSSASEARIQAATFRGVKGGGPNSSDIYEDEDAPTWPAPPTGRPEREQVVDIEPERVREEDVVVHTLRPGETTWDLAGRYYGDRNEVRRLVDANDLLDPYTLQGGIPIRPGATLRIPGTGGGVQPAATGSVEEMFGVDLYINPETGDLEVTEDGKDVRTVTGPALLEQAIRHRMLTRQGECALWPDYGLPVVPGDSIGPRMRGYVASHIREQLLQDSRIRAVENIAIVEEGDAVSVAVEVIPKVGDPIEVVAPLPRRR